MDPDYAQHLQSFLALTPPGPPVLDVSVLRGGMEKRTQLVEKYHAPYRPPESKYRVHDYQVPVEGGEILVRSLVPTPDSSSSEFPLVVWYHGGGWALGSIALDDAYLRKFAVDLKLSILLVEYRLAPEHPFPTGINDAYTGLKWAAENPTLLSASLARGFIVGGVSAGANFAAVLARRARDDPFFDGRNITGQVLHVPMVVHPDVYPEQFTNQLVSIEENKDAPLLSKASISYFLGLLKPPPTDPDFSILLSPDHTHLPPALIQVAGQDPLRDEGIVYGKVLGEAGVEVRTHVYPGLHHAAHVWLPETAISARFWQDFEDGLGWLLSLTKNGE